MATPLIQNAFASGELSPALSGRTDLPKYRSGAALMRNFYVDYRGGASTRPGTQIVGILPDFSPDAARLIPFRFSTEQAYVLELQGGRMRVIRDGAYITNTPVSITNIVPADSGTKITVTAPGNTFGSVNQQVFIADVVGCLRPNGISGINGRTLRVISVSGDDVILEDVLGQSLASNTWTVYTSGGTAAQIYNINTPWSANQLFELKYVQSADVLTVVHSTTAPQNINRIAEDNWTITSVVFGAKLNAPENLTYIRHDGEGPDFAYPYCVTAYNTKTGDESAPSLPLIARNEALNQTTGVTNEMHWDPVSGADLYRLYKAQAVPWGSQGGGPYFWGLIGQTAALNYQDVNYAPQADAVPPTSQNPFGYGALGSVTLVTPGYGYVNPMVVVTPGIGSTGSGAQVAAQRDNGGSITSVTITSGGQNYLGVNVGIVETDTADGTGATLAFDGTWIPDPSHAGWYIPGPGSVTITNGGTGYHAPLVTLIPSIGGAGPNGIKAGLISISAGGAIVSLFDAAGSIDATTVNPAATMTFNVIDGIPGANFLDALAVVTGDIGTSDNPSVVAYFQQRRVFAATPEAPQTFWTSRPGLYENFDTSFPSQDNDSISGTLVGNDVNSILSLTTIASGLVALTSGGAWLITGGASAPITPSAISALPQAFYGADPLAPLLVGSDLVYMQARGSAVQSIAFDFYQNSLVGQDITVLSSHLLRRHRLKQWCWSKEPNKLLWAVRDDGVLLSCTYAEGREIIGWSWHDTAGEYVSVTTIPEGDEDAVYVVTRRYLAAGSFAYVTERLVNRNTLGNAEKGIPSDPEAAWSVDAGRAYAPAVQSSALFVSNVTLGALADLEIVAPGSGYPNSPTVVIDDPTGTGGAIQVTITAGVIVAAMIITAGSGYTNPTIRFEGQGMGGVLSIAAQDLIDFSSSLSITSADIGTVIRYGGGKGVMVADLGSGGFRAKMDSMPLPIANLPLNETIYPGADAGEWSFTKPVTVVGNLDHFNGMAVAVVADGSAIDPRVVADGCITLDRAASWVTAGEGYSCQLQTLRLPEAETRRKQIPAITVRTMDTRGLLVGTDFGSMMEIKDRPIETPMRDPQPFQTGGGPIVPQFEDAPSSRQPLTYDDHRTIISAMWRTEGQLCFQQNYPMPATILAAMPEVNVGDNPG